MSETPSQMTPKMLLYLSPNLARLFLISSRALSAFRDLVMHISLHAHAPSIAWWLLTHLRRMRRLLYSTPPLSAFGTVLRWSFRRPSWPIDGFLLLFLGWPAESPLRISPLTTVSFKGMRSLAMSLTVKVDQSQLSFKSLLGLINWSIYRSHHRSSWPDSRKIRNP